MSDRRADARQVRTRLAKFAFHNGHADHVANGEEADYPYLANYSKGLPHNALGEVDSDAYRRMLRALCSGEHADFDSIPLSNAGDKRPLTNPQAGLAFDLEGPDGPSLAIRPAPRIDGPENSFEMAELYWMALCRDVRFMDFDTNATVGEAVADLANFSFVNSNGGPPTRDTLFRGFTRGDHIGPYVSQFLLKQVPFGTLRISQRQSTVAAGVDYLTDFAAWLAAQNGVAVPQTPVNVNQRRYAQTPRDLAHYVHFDALYEAYLNACLILLGSGAPLDAGNPYIGSPNQAGFGTFGGPHILSLVTEVATRALKAVWYQKWFVHRRLRPEAFGGLIHNHKSAAKAYDAIHEEILASAALDKIHQKYGSYLLPQAFPEGSPTHPAYGAGHATVAGACVTILKAWFDESHVLADPEVPTNNGESLKPYNGLDKDRLTVGGELNKLAANIAIGRNMGGVHWRSDYSESVKLGEAIAIGILREQKELTNEDATFTISRFDGTSIRV
jgi:hypothetical protein